MYTDVSLFIDGEWTAGTSGKSEPILNPATGRPPRRRPLLRHRRGGRAGRQAPAGRGGRVGIDKLRSLAAAISAVLEEAIAAGGSSLRDFARPDGELGYFSKQFDVYDREGEPCRGGCAGTVKRIVQGGRSTFYCTCQR